MNEVRKLEELTVVKERMKLYNKSDWSEEERERINTLQTKRDDTHMNKARGAYLMSGARWIEEGEKNTAYFCNLEKRREEHHSICQFMIDGEECTDPKRISNEVYDFYSTLYKSSYSEHNATLFLDKIKDWIPVTDNSFKEICDDAEFDCAIKNMASDRSPGPDGLTANFYKHFWEDLKSLLFEAIIECANRKEVMETMKQGIIKLLPKPGKDVTQSKTNNTFKYRL